MARPRAQHRPGRAATRGCAMPAQLKIRLPRQVLHPEYFVKCGVAGLARIREVDEKLNSGEFSCHQRCWLHGCQVPAIMDATRAWIPHGAASCRCATRPPFRVGRATLAPPAGLAATLLRKGGQEGSHHDVFLNSSRNNRTPRNDCRSASTRHPQNIATSNRPVRTSLSPPHATSRSPAFLREEDQIGGGP